MYKESEEVAFLRRQLGEHTLSRPGDYTSRYEKDLADAAEGLLNREAFQYDLSGDALWRQYQDRYVNLGRQAMLDTLGKASALTGGYGNSHAQIAGQQVYGSYLQGLYDQIPQLYSLALERYDREGQALRDRYGLLSDLEQGDYSRHQDALAAWQGEREYLQGLYDDGRDFDYGAYRDAVGDEQWQLEFDEALRQFNFKNGLGEFAPTVGGKTGGNLSGEQEEEPKRKKNRFTTIHRMQSDKEAKK